jgi:very-short-patch-repair endonuclease
LRRALTLPEVLLWQVLRSRPGGYRFRRQHPAGPYVLDFFCAAAGLCIEVDGKAMTWATIRLATCGGMDGSRIRGTGR